MGTAPPDWHLFRAFLAVVREGSLSGAARVLGTTQPTMGRQVAALEASLGVKLFTRSLDGLSPTEAGMRLIPSAEAMAAAVEAAQRSASGEIDEERGTVRITASDVIGAEVLPPMLADFHSLNPRISAELALSNRNEDLLRGDADIAVRMVRPPQGALIARRIGRIDIGLYGHRGYLKGRPMPRQLEDLGEHALIGYDRDKAYVRLLERMGLPFTRDRFAFRSDSDLPTRCSTRGIWHRCQSTGSRKAGKKSRSRAPLRTHRSYGVLARHAPRLAEQPTNPAAVRSPGDTIVGLRGRQLL